MEQFIKVFMNFFSMDSLPLLIGLLLIIYIFYKQYILPKLNNLSLLNSVDERISNISIILSECEKIIEEIKLTISLMKEKIINLEKIFDNFSDHLVLLENILKDIENLKQMSFNSSEDIKNFKNELTLIYNGLQKIYDLLFSSAKIRNDVDKEILKKLENFNYKLENYNEKLFNDKKIDYFK